MHHHLFKILPTISWSKALKELKNKGIKNHYLIEDHTDKCIGGFFETSPKDLLYLEEQPLTDTIDWQEQAQLHCPYYKEGLIDIPLKDFGFDSSKNVKLHPGAGFGDLSHPTTKLMLHSMARWVNSESLVLDIGSGSGILALAAHIALGSKVLGLEIDPKALELSKKNAVLNNALEVRFQTHISQETFNSFSVILLNMISSEQKEVFKAYCFNDFKGLIIISGVLNSEKDYYLKQLPLNNLKLLTSSSESDWICFVIENS